MLWLRGKIIFKLEDNNKNFTAQGLANLINGSAQMGITLNELLESLKDNEKESNFKELLAENLASGNSR